MTPDAQTFAQNRSVRLCRTLLLVFSLVVAQFPLGFAVAQEQRITLDIGPQPLDQALDAFGAVTGFQIFYETALTAGRRSSAVRGVFDRETALRVLLAGSDLTARVIAANTISIAPLPGISADLQQAKQASVAYYGSMQTSIMKALCRNAETRPGTYRIAMQYWIDGMGRIARFKMIASSGDTGRDDAIRRAMQSVVFQPPLRDLPQPVTLAIEPAARDEPAGCGPAGRTDVSRVQ